MNKRYFFDRDDDGHWYMLPFDKRGEWSQWLDNYEGYEDKYKEHMLGRNINKISFENPEEIKPEEPLEEKVKNFNDFLNEKLIIKEYREEDLN